jgi:DNA (cytosine-5)-methyltransferase 1
VAKMLNRKPKNESETSRPELSAFDETTKPEGAGADNVHNTPTRSPSKSYLGAENYPPKSGRVVVDLFCGGGGFSEGARLAGADVILALDNWPEALATHKANHPQTIHHQVELGDDYLGSIESISGLIREAVEIDGREFHLHASPPCQNLSSAKGAGRDVGEGMRLVLWFLELVEALRGEWSSWSMEQVLPVAKHLPEWVHFEIVNAADYGVPQTRRRVIAGEGWSLRQTHTSTDWVSVLDALPKLVEEGLSTMVHGGNLEATNPRNMATAQAFTITGISPHQIKLNSGGYGASKSAPSFSYERAITEPAKTINNNQPSLRDSKPSKIRCLTMAETLTIQGFSPDYDLGPAKTQKARWQIIGNSVCPPVASAIVRGWLQPIETLWGWQL